LIFPFPCLRLQTTVADLPHFWAAWVRQSRQMLPEIGREPTPEELAKKRAMPLEKVCKLLIKKVSGAALWRDFEAKECACRNPDAQERDRYDN
jgi:Sigma-70 region 3